MQPRQSQQFEDRFMNFWVEVIQFAGKRPLPASIAIQVIRASTSIGANYAEAQNAASKSGFRNKISIAKKEAAETRYWLRLVGRLCTGAPVQPLLQETHEIILILQNTPLAATE